MNETVSLSLAWAGGILFGTLFFWSRRWMDRMGVLAKSPEISYFIGLSFRAGLALAGFYWVSRGPWQGIPVYLVGFVIGFLIVTRLTRRGKDFYGRERND